MLKLSKKIALPLIAVLLIGTGVGSYFLFKNFQIPKYFVDKYPELIEYCDTQESENGLKVSCKALMLDIKPNASDGTPSLTSLVIANDEELKEYTITEKEEVFAWTNDVLQYKKLKPIVINIQYTKGSLLKYSLSNITFEDIPDTYIQDIVNRDIEEIMGMDKSSTTILNSFDFCPRPETLPDYVIKKEEYAKYWEENILSEEEYQKKLNLDYQDFSIEKFFLCDSSQNIGYKKICDTSNIKNLNYINQNTQRFSISTKSISTSDEITNHDMESLKNASLLYDHFYFNEGIIVELIASFDSFVNNIQSTSEFPNISLCAMSRIYKALSITHKEFKLDSDNIQTILLETIDNPHSSLCSADFENLGVNSSGLYLKNYINRKQVFSQFEIFEKCNNLNFFVK